jgi:hypothetical protein
VHLVLEVRQEGDVIPFRDRSGRSFRTYEGTWEILQDQGQTVIRYELTAQPSFDVPEFLLGRLLKRDATRMIDALREEMAVRGSQAARTQ